VADTLKPGDTAELLYTLADSAGVPVDAVTLQLRVQAPGGTISTYLLGQGTVTRLSVGSYRALIPVTTPGAYPYAWEATGSVPDTTEGSLYVAASLIGGTPQRRRLARMVASFDAPVLTDEDLDELLRMARRPDSGGLLPSEPGWVATYDLDDAACMGWEIKAGRAAAGFDFAPDGQRFNRSQIHAQCMAMARLYRRGLGSVRVPSVAAG
jgi:hypothetical protein